VRSHHLDEYEGVLAYLEILKNVEWVSY